MSNVIQLNRGIMDDGFRLSIWEAQLRNLREAISSNMNTDEAKKLGLKIGECLVEIDTLKQKNSMLGITEPHPEYGFLTEREHKLLKRSNDKNYYLKDISKRRESIYNERKARG